MRNLTVPPEMIRNIRALSIRLPVRIRYNEKQIDARALLDSGAEGIYCNAEFIQRNKLPLKNLDHPIYPKNVDGSLNCQGAIRHATILHMEMGETHREYAEFLVTNTGDHDMLLGTDWLKAHNPSVNWATNTVTLNRCPTLCFPPKPEISLLAHLLPIMDWEPQDDDSQDSSASLGTMQRVRAHLDKYDELEDPVLARTTVSTHLAKTVQVVQKEIPPEFRQHHQVFANEEAQRLPKHQPWDHKINLIPGKQICKTSIYRLTPPEKIALQDYITMGLKQGSLHRSEAPDACSFFFIDKKDGKLRPVPDYRLLNDITRKNAAPIPLIPELIDKLLGARFFTKLDVRWGYNNIRIQEGDEWKAAFKMPLGLFEHGNDLWVM